MSDRQNLAELATLVEDCEAREDRLSDWERGFIDSVGRSILRGYYPSPAQVESLNEVWERATARG